MKKANSPWVIGKAKYNVSVVRDRETGDVIGSIEYGKDSAGLFYVGIRRDGERKQFSLRWFAADWLICDYTERNNEAASAASAPLTREQAELVQSAIDNEADTLLERGQRVEGGNAEQAAIDNFDAYVQSGELTREQFAQLVWAPATRLDLIVEAEVVRPAPTEEQWQEFLHQINGDTPIETAAEETPMLEPLDWDGLLIAKRRELLRAADLWDGNTYADRSWRELPAHIQFDLEKAYAYTLEVK